MKIIDDGKHVCEFEVNAKEQEHTVHCNTIEGLDCDIDSRNVMSFQDIDSIFFSIIEDVDSLYISLEEHLSLIRSINNINEIGADIISIDKLEKELDNKIREHSLLCTKVKNSIMDSLTYANSEIIDGLSSTRSYY